MMEFLLVRANFIADIQQSTATTAHNFGEFYRSRVKKNFFKKNCKSY